MDLINMREQTTNMKSNMEYLIKQYQSIVTSLDKQYRILGNKDAEESRILQGIITKYNRVIEMISKDSMESMNRILDYIDRSQRNIEQLTSSITNSIKSYGAETQANSTEGQ